VSSGELHCASAGSVHFHADDTQLCVSFDPSGARPAVTKVKSQSGVCEWMAGNSHVN